VAHLLYEQIHNDERDNWQERFIILYIVNFIDYEPFVEQGLVGIFVQYRFVFTPSVKLL